jgi:c-di-GMP-binding flagellar brake protein YcgR
VESVPQDHSLIDDLIEQQKPAGVSFKTGHHKVVFATPLLERVIDYRINAEVTVEAVRLRLPDSIKAVQRRGNYRVPVRPDDDLRVRIWRIAERVYLRDRPMAAQELLTEVRDLSLGGLGVTFHPKDGQPPKISSADRLRIELAYADNSFLIEGRMIHPDGPKGNVPLRAGIQFKALENNLLGRQTLAEMTKLVSALQREEIRRHRLGLSA